MTISLKNAALIGSLVPDAFVSRILNDPGSAQRMLAVIDRFVRDEPERRDVRVATGPNSGLKLAATTKGICFWLGTFERGVQLAICRYGRPGMPMWDVGAFNGFHALTMRKLAGPGRVLAIEPDPANRRLLEHNLKLNDFVDVTVLPLVIGSGQGYGRAERISERPSQTTFVESADGDCKISGLDELLDRFAAPGLIKMDIEGAEAAAMAGAKTLLRDVRPTWILEAHGSSGEAALADLRAADYHIIEDEEWTHAPARLIGGGEAHFFAIPSERWKP